MGTVSNLARYWVGYRNKDILARSFHVKGKLREMELVLPRLGHQFVFTLFESSKRNFSWTWSFWFSKLKDIVIIKFIYFYCISLHMSRLVKLYCLICLPWYIIFCESLEVCSRLLKFTKNAKMSILSAWCWFDLLYYLLLCVRLPLVLWQARSLVSGLPSPRRTFGGGARAHFRNSGW